MTGERSAVVMLPLGLAVSIGLALMIKLRCVDLLTPPRASLAYGTGLNKAFQGTGSLDRSRDGSFHSGWRNACSGARRL